MTDRRTSMPALETALLRGRRSMVGLVTRGLSRTGYRLERSIVVCGTPRSGTTWIADAIASTPGSRVLFEPLHVNRVPAVARAGIGWRPYIRPDRDWPAAEEFFRRVLEGRILNDWTAQQIGRPTRVRSWVVKFIRANLMVVWLAQRFPIRPPLLLLRHPCAVVASQLAQSWEVPRGLDDPELLTDHPDVASILKGLRHPEELHAVRWAIDTMIPLTQGALETCITLTYEQIVEEPSVLEALFERWEIPRPPRLEDRLERWSHTTGSRRTTPRAKTVEWRSQLTPDATRRVLEVVHAFGLDFYGEDPDPDLDRLARWSAAP